MKRKSSNEINNINKKIDGPEFNRSEMIWL